MLLTLFLCCNQDSQYTHNSSQPHQSMKHVFLVLFFMHFYASSPHFLPFILLTPYCSLTLLLDDSRFALVTAPPLCPPFFPPDTAQVQPHLAQWAPLRMQQYTEVSHRVIWGRTKVLDFLSEAMVREARLLFPVPCKS